MDIAKKLLTETVDSLQQNTQLELALRVYGHLYPRQYQHCKDSRLEVPFSINNHQQIKDKLREITPKGTTPIAYSLEQAAADFSTASHVRNIIIMITDGIESCGGDPCAVSAALQRKQVILQPFIIALGAEEGFEQQFDCMGAYFDASSIDGFRKALNSAIKRSLAKTTVSVEIVDEQGAPTETDINLSFLNSFTREVSYNFVHYRNREGQTDTLQVDPVVTYDIYAHTIPAVAVQDWNAQPGTHNTIQIQAPQGSLKLSQRNHQEYSKGVQAIIRQAGKPATLHVQAMGSGEKYLAGTYDLEVLSLPRTYFAKVTIQPGKETLVELPAPGILNIRADFVGIGDVYSLKEGQSQQLIYKLNDKSPVNSLALQPGNYRLVFRARQAQGSRFTKVRDFVIKPGETTNINLFGK